MEDLIKHGYLRFAFSSFLESVHDHDAFMKNLVEELDLESWKFMTVDSEDVVQLSKRHELILGCLAQMIVIKKIPLRDLNKRIKAQLLPLVYLSILQVEFVPMIIAREALLLYHMCYLEVKDSNIYVEDALSDAIREMALDNYDCTKGLEKCCWIALTLGQYYFKVKKWELAAQRLLKVYEWIEDARLYEDPDFNPVNHDLLIRLLKVALAAINDDQKDFPGRNNLNLKWCPLFLHFKNHSRDEIVINGISDIFLHNVIKKDIPADVQLQILKDIPFSRHSKEAVILYTATLFASDNIYDMTLKFNLTLMPILKSCTDPSLSSEMINTIKHIKSIASKFAIEKDELFNGIHGRLIRLIGGGEEVWRLCAKDELEYHDIQFLKNTFFKEIGYGIRSVDEYKENLADVLLSHCIFENMEDMVRYTQFAHDTFNRNGNMEIHSTLFFQAKFLYDRRYFAASATLVEAVWQYFYDSLSENIEKELTQLHQHAILSFYIESHQPFNQLNDWIDQYFDSNEGYGDSRVLGKLCMALFNPKDKMQENSSFSILNRLASMLEAHNDSAARTFVLIMRNLFIMSQLISEYTKKSNHSKNVDQDEDGDIKLQIKSYAYDLTMKISEPDNGSFLLEALSDYENSALFQMIGGCIVGWIHQKRAICRDWFGKCAQIRSPKCESISKFINVILELSNEKCSRIITFLINIYESLASSHTSADFYFALGELCFVEKCYSKSFKYYLNGLAIATYHFSRLDFLKSIFSKTHFRLHLVSSASRSGGNYILYSHRKAHAFIPFLSQMIPEIDQGLSKDYGDAELKKWLESSHSKIKLIEEYPGHLGIVSCIFNVLILEKAYYITGDERIIKVIVCNNIDLIIQGRKELCEQDQEKRFGYTSEIARLYFQRFTLEYGA